MASNSPISIAALPAIRRPCGTGLSSPQSGRRCQMSASDRVGVGAVVPRDFASRLDRSFGVALEVSTALLVVAEIGILFVGIVARYAFHHPLIWSDELASLLFLWLAMLGTVLALRRGEHMRMTALIN